MSRWLGTALWQRQRANSGSDQTRARDLAGQAFARLRDGQRYGYLTRRLPDGRRVKVLVAREAWGERVVSRFSKQASIFEYAMDSGLLCTNPIGPTRIFTTDALKDRIAGDAPLIKAIQVIYDGNISVLSYDVPELDDNDTYEPTHELIDDHPERYTGLARLLVQARNGTGKDMESLLATLPGTWDRSPATIGVVRSHLSGGPLTWWLVSTYPAIKAVKLSFEPGIEKLITVFLSLSASSVSEAIIIEGYILANASCDITSIAEFLTEQQVSELLFKANAYEWTNAPVSYFWCWSPQAFGTDGADQAQAVSVFGESLNNPEPKPPGYVGAWGLFHTTKTHLQCVFDGGQLTAIEYTSTEDSSIPFSAFITDIGSSIPMYFWRGNTKQTRTNTKPSAREGNSWLPERLVCALFGQSGEEVNIFLTNRNGEIGGSPTWVDVDWGYRLRIARNGCEDVSYEGWQLMTSTVEDPATTSLRGVELLLGGSPGIFAVLSWNADYSWTTDGRLKTDITSVVLDVFVDKQEKLSVVYDDLPPVYSPQQHPFDNSLVNIDCFYIWGSYGQVAAVIADVYPNLYPAAKVLSDPGISETIELNKAGSGAEFIGGV